ncbi:MAG: hypothetical protein AAF202_10140, partial [Pseudomonadota bacterium]
MKAGFRILLIVLGVFTGVANAQGGCPFELAKTAETSEVLKIGSYHLDPIHSYDRVLDALTADPYDYFDLPVIDVDLFRNWNMEVASRSRDILTERHVIKPEWSTKTIHPMGIPVAGTMHFFGTDLQGYSGVFRGGSFPILGRFSLSQGNPFRLAPQTRWQWLRGIPPQPQPRSVTMGLLLFDPDVDASSVSPIVSLVLQNDLNGKLDSLTGEADYFLSQNVL